MILQLKTALFPVFVNHVREYSEQLELGCNLSLILKLYQMFAEMMFTLYSLCRYLTLIMSYNISYQRAVKYTLFSDQSLLIRFQKAAHILVPAVGCLLISYAFYSHSFQREH